MKAWEVVIYLVSLSNLNHMAGGFLPFRKRCGELFSRDSKMDSIWTGECQESWRHRVIYQKLGEDKN